MKITDSIDKFLKYCKVVKRRADSTINNYSYHLHDIMEPFVYKRGCRRIADVTDVDLRALMNYVKTVKTQRGEPMTPHSQRNCLSAIKSFFKYAKLEIPLAINPAEFVPYPPDHTKLPDQPLSADDVADIIDSIPCESVYDLRLRAMIELMYGAALRANEICKLNVHDFSKRMDEITAFNRKYYKNTTLDVTKTMRSAVQDYLAMRDTLVCGVDEGALFLNQYGGRMTYQTVWSDMQKVNDLRSDKQVRVHPHMYRHAICHWYLEQGVDLTFIQQLLDHKNLSTIMWYLKLSTAEIKKFYVRSVLKLNLDYG